MPYSRARVIVSERLPFLISVPGLLVAAGWLQAAGPVVRFDLSNPDVRPFPTDAPTVPDDMQKTGMRAALPMSDCQAESSSCAEIALLYKLDGFNREVP